MLCRKLRSSASSVTAEGLVRTAHESFDGRCRHGGLAVEWRNKLGRVDARIVIVAAVDKTRSYPVHQPLGRLLVEFVLVVPAGPLPDGA